LRLKLTGKTEFLVLAGCANMKKVIGKIKTLANPARQRKKLLKLKLLGVTVMTTISDDFLRKSRHFCKSQCYI
jgi:hypothetical protein